MYKLIIFSFKDQKSSLSPCSSLPNEISQANLLSNSYESKAYSSQTPSSSPSSTPNSSNSSAANSPIHESALNDHPSFLLPVQPPPVPQPPTSSSNPSSVSMFPFVPSLLMRASNGFHESTGNEIDGSEEEKGKFHFTFYFLSFK